MPKTDTQVTAGILAPANAEKRAEILALLERAYWMEMETVMSYVANAAALDGIRAEEVAEALDATITDFQHGPQRDDVALLVLEAD